MKLTTHQIAFAQGLLVFIVSNIGTAIGQVPVIQGGTVNITYLILTLLPAIGAAALTYTHAHPGEAGAAEQDTVEEIKAFIASLLAQQQQATTPPQGHASAPLVVIHAPATQTVPQAPVVVSQQPATPCGGAADQNPLTGISEGTVSLPAVNATPQNDLQR